MTRVLQAYINEFHVGTLSALDNIWRFDYTKAWAEAEHGYDLSPALPRRDGMGESKAESEAARKVMPSQHIDGSTDRPVQWYFDNLLPEEALRSVLAKQADVDESDAFGLLAYYGRESAGSLVLLPEGEAAVAAGMRPLPLEQLSARIRAMPRIPLSAASPKHMSLAGAQHKLALIYQDHALFEPDGPTASTHILKPQHPDKASFPASVVNEYFTMRLAHALGLDVPQVQRLFCPEPVFLTARFDRVTSHDGVTERLHVIDACQLLNKDRAFKYSAASVEALAEVINYLQVPAAGRQWLYDWIVFNVLIGNGDNHLKNLSFMVSPDRIVIAPCYDLLCTAAYDTEPIAGDLAEWPNTKLALRLDGATQNFSQITREVMIAAGRALGLARATAVRRLDYFLARIPAAVSRLREEIRQENAQCSEDIAWGLAQDGLLLGVIEHIIVAQMCAQLEKV